MSRMLKGTKTQDYRNACDGRSGPLAFTWSDKPHRLVYDLAGEVDALKETIARLRRHNRMLREKLRKADYGYFIYR